MMNIVFLGPQGSGKSTQAKLLARHLGVPLISTGDLMRAKARENTALSKRVRDTINQGNLVDDKTLLAVLKEEFKKSKYEAGMVLDGVPRSQEQAEALAGLISIDKVFNLVVSEKEGVKRLLRRARHDDTPEIIEKRLEQYQTKTRPILEYYRQKGILEDIDGERSIEKIQEDIRARLDD